MLKQSMQKVDSPSRCYVNKLALLLSNTTCVKAPSSAYSCIICSSLESAAIERECFEVIIEI